MKKVWTGLSIACLAIGILGTIEDMMEGNPFWDSVIILFVMVFPAAFFGWLAWLWRIRSPIKRAAEQAGAVAESVKSRQEAYQGMSKSLKRRAWKFRICGILVMAFGIWIWIAGDWDTFFLVIGTVVLIIGLAVIMMGSPQDYNAATDALSMIGMDKKRKISEFCEAFREIQTPLGSCWMGRFHTSPYDTMIFGPDARGQYIYFYLNGSGEVGYIGYSFLKGAISERLSDPLFPPKKDLGADVAGHLCYHTDVFFFRDWLKESIEHFLKTGQPLPFRESQPSEVYTFTEDFKLTGQHFEVQDRENNTVYVVDATVPLLNLYVYDTQHSEIFRMTKEVGHALATYRFFYRGEPYGVLEKQFTFIRDRFVMEVQEGKLELTEYAGTVGHNFKVTLNGKLLGAIMDNMDLTIQNVVFDNAFLIVYDKEHLALVTAMAVMVARELVRDKDGGLSNRVSADRLFQKQE